ncbi:MAG: hypothetical protein PHT37_05325 [Candidatus Cloacimonetes bacterium]|nr:hypothetical protein [Candidatus Cloacimonadota bacterium]
MKRIAILLLVILPIALASVSFTDYTSPTSSGQEAFLNGNFNFKSGNQDQASYNGLLGGNYLNYYNSLPINWRIGADGNLELLRGSADGAEANTGYAIKAYTNADKYLNNSNVFGYGALDLGYRKNINLDDADDPYAKIGIGAGYGRVMDATVLSKAMRIVDELIKYEVIKNPLTTEGYIALAQIIDKEGQYKTQYGRDEYKKYWYEAMEDVFNQENLLPAGSLHALGIIRLQEVLDQRFSSRKYGWTVRAGVGYVLSSYDGLDQDPTLDISAEYALPISNKLQFIERMDYSTILSDDISHTIYNKASLTYELSSMMDWENKLTTALTIPSASGAKTIIDNTLESIFYYYLSNKVNLNASLRFHMLDDGVKDNGNDDLDMTFFVGATYRLR